MEKYEKPVMEVEEIENDTILTSTPPITNCTCNVFGYGGGSGSGGGR